MNLFLLLLLLVSVVSARLTPEQKAARKKVADEADKSIDFVAHKDLESTIAKGTWLVFYGAHWCPYTQKLTPQWLNLQKRLKAEGTTAGTDFQIRKLECATDESFCTKKGVNGYPTLLLYKNGKEIEEYPDEDTEEPIMRYIKYHVDLLKKEQLPQPKSKPIIDKPLLQKSEEPTTNWFVVLLVLVIAVAGIMRYSSKKSPYSRI